MEQTRKSDEQVRTRRRAIDHPDVALWRLVRAGAPPSWLWLEPEVIVREQNRYRAALEHEFAGQAPEEQGEMRRGRFDHRPQHFGHLSAFRRVMQLLHFQWHKHSCAS